MLERVSDRSRESRWRWVREEGHLRTASQRTAHVADAQAREVGGDTLLGELPHHLRTSSTAQSTAFKSVQEP